MIGEAKAPPACVVAPVEKAPPAELQASFHQRPTSAAVQGLRVLSVAEFRTNVDPVAVTSASGELPVRVGVEASAYRLFGGWHSWAFFIAQALTSQILSRCHASLVFNFFHRARSDKVSDTLSVATGVC